MATLADGTKRALEIASRAVSIQNPRFNDFLRGNIQLATAISTQLALLKATWATEFTASGGVAGTIQSEGSIDQQIAAIQPEDLVKWLRVNRQMAERICDELAEINTQWAASTIVSGAEFHITLFAADEVTFPTPVTATTTTTTDTGLLTVTTITADTTLTTSNNRVRVDASAGPIEVTLLTAVGNEGRKFAIKKIDSTTNPVTIKGSGSETIDGGSEAVLTEQYEAIGVYSNATNYDIDE